ncbi:L,D-transpeptidase family protein [Sinorhizobium meliloti]|nr:L,D-transpeptidase family protein [Sinorhizobium meliloti]
MSSNQPVLPKGPDPYFVEMYGAKPDEKFPLPATDISKVEPRFLRQQVPYVTHEPPGTVVIDTENRFLYLVQGRGMALVYGSRRRQGRAGFEGEARRRPQANGRAGRRHPTWSRANPSATDRSRRHGPRPAQSTRPRALYLYQGNRDTLFRIHGTTEAWSIGKAVSSGCIRLFNPDIIDLYSRVPKARALSCSRRNRR